MKNLWTCLVIMAFLIVADQLSKGSIQSSMAYGESIPVIKGMFNITYVKNSGAAFGMGAGAHDWIRWFFFLILPVFACLWLLKLIWTTRNQHLFYPLTYSLILAGAIGNLIDRFSLGYVVDFLDFYYGNYHFWTFNIADSAISVAAILLVGEFIVGLRKKSPEKYNVP